MTDGELALRAEVGQLLQELEGLQQQRAALEAKVMEYVNRNAQLRDSVVRMREKLRHTRETIVTLREELVAKDDEIALETARVRGLEQGYYAAFGIVLDRQRD